MNGLARKMIAKRGQSFPHPLDVLGESSDARGQTERDTAAKSGERVVRRSRIVLAKVVVKVPEARDPVS
jgi:hypothetical protein